MKKRNIITLIAVLILTAIAAYFMLSSGFLQSIFSSTSVETGKNFGDIPGNTALPSGSSGKQIRVSFLDVAQGDSTFIEFPDKTCMAVISFSFFISLER